MVTTRAQNDSQDNSHAGDKRPADSAASNSPSKKQKVENDEEKDLGEGAQDDRDSKDDEKEGKAPRPSKSKKEEDDGERDAPHSKSKNKSTAPDGMDEDKKMQEPEGPEVEGNAGPGEIAPGMREMSGEEAKRKHGVLEKGHIYFLYRPKVETNDPQSIDDIQRFHFLLVPEDSKLHRLIAVGKKQLPDASQGGRPMWGEVFNIGEDLKALKEALGPSTYETKTRGTRHQPGARVTGAGAYVLHSTENPPENSSNMSAVYHTHLAYELAIPHEIGEVQEALHIESTGSFTLQVKNPDSATTNPIVGNQPKSKHPQFPPALKELFTTKYIPTDPPALLDYPGAELLLIPSKHSAAEAVGENAKKELDEEEKELEKEIEGEKGDSDAKKALKEMGFEGLIEGKALEGHWE
ncbi:hypothetical protein JCM8547_004712 [Rhodosporidiobolus lusitaniae]